MKIKFFYLSKEQKKTLKLEDLSQMIEEKVDEIITKSFKSILQLLRTILFEQRP